MLAHLAQNAQARLNRASRIRRRRRAFKKNWDMGTDIFTGAPLLDGAIGLTFGLVFALWLIGGLS